jgi:hypothetical protein
MVSRFVSHVSSFVVASIFTASAFAGTVSKSDGPDGIVLADGKEIECRVLLESDAKLVYRAKGKTHELARDEVKEVRTQERSLAEFLERFDAVDPRDASAWVELARFAAQRGLAGEARHTALRALTVEPDHAGAWELLGGVKRRQGWQLKVDGRFVTFDEFRARGAGWKDAVELPTTHFVLRTDVPLERAVDLAIDLERAYATFYGLLGSLELHAFDERPEIHVFADSKDYPEPPTAGRPAWFALFGNTLYVDASRREESGPIVSELVEALTFNAFRRTTGKTGEIEPWARKGLAAIFAGAVRPSPGHVEFELDAPYLPYFRAQASDREALTLEQVLRAGFASFDSGADASRFSAQTYTLAHFLLFHDGGKHRARFAEFLRRSYFGKGGTSSFFEVMGVDERTLEQEWRSYVGSLASA